jgi:hypothetical protein
MIVKRITLYYTKKDGLETWESGSSIREAKSTANALIKEGFKNVRIWVDTFKIEEKGDELIDPIQVELYQEVKNKLVKTKG